MYKLTLTVSQEVAERAKQLAKRRGTSVSKMVEAFLDKASRGEEDVKPESVLREIQAMLKNSTATMDDYYKHFDEKYR